MSDQDELSLCWDLLYPPAKDQEPSLLERAIGSGSLVIGTKNNVLVTIDSDGVLSYGDDYTPDGAAEVFWEALQRQRVAEEERDLLIAHMEGVLTALGAADIHNEAMSRNLLERQSTDNLVAGHQAQNPLERAMQQAIELGRGLTRRPQVSRIPVRLPRVLREDPDNGYTGQSDLVEPGPPLGDS